MDLVIPAAVRAAFELDDREPEPITVGWINRTFVAWRQGERVVVQRLHPIFSGEVNLDIDVVTRHLESAGLVTPRIVHTREGRAWVDAEGVWRVLTHVPGRTLGALDAEHARAAGVLVGRFQRALADLRHEFAFVRRGAHDTAAHLEKLEALRRKHPDAGEIGALAADIVARGRELPSVAGLPLRIVHGDLKATNILFAHERTEAVALVDLDTLAHGTMAVELGDALRSWCNPGDESDASARFDAARFERALSGLAEGAGGLFSKAETDAIIPGVETITLELASRFGADVYEDRYFGWDATRFASRVEHNLARTRAQLALAESVAGQRERLDAIVRSIFPD